MDDEYWKKRWRENEIGFHKDVVNPWLLRFAAEFPAASARRILVPLCGKSLDLAWLAHRGLEVDGVELCELAIGAFLTENCLQAAYRTDGPFRVAELPRLRLWIGDFFAAEPERLGVFDAVWDRAALIALPAHERARYAAQLRRLVAPGGVMQLVTVRYDQSKIDGPPYSVDDDEVRRLYRGFEVALLAEESTSEIGPKFQEKGVQSMTDAVYRLRAPR